MYHVDLEQEQATQEASRLSTDPFNILTESSTAPTGNALEPTPSLVQDLAKSTSPLPKEFDLTHHVQESALHRASRNPAGANPADPSQWRPLNELQHKSLAVLAAALLAGYAKSNPHLDGADHAIVRRRSHLDRHRRGDSHGLARKRWHRYIHEPPCTSRPLDHARSLTACATRQQQPLTALHGRAQEKYT